MKLVLTLLALAVFISGVCNYEILLTPFEFVNTKDWYTTSRMLKIEEKDIARSIAFSKSTVESLRRLEQNILNAAISNPHRSSASNTDEISRKISKQALIMEKASMQLISRYCFKGRYSPNKCARLINEYNATNNDQICTNLNQTCNGDAISRVYRTPNGACNHDNDVTLGQSFTGYIRLAFPEYLDGLHLPRRSTNRKFLLPSPRAISNTMIQRESDKDMHVGQYTIAFAHWGELVEHDLTQTLPSKMIHFDRYIKCCSEDGKKLAPRHIHPLCHAIDVPHDDAFYAKYDVKCLSYVRSMGSIRDDCSFGPVDQLNQATHYLDASNIYGNDETTAAKLRNGIGGQMRTSHANFLPKVSAENNRESYEAGDARVNSHLQLTTLHTILLREHNRIAQKLAEINPHWSDEKLYQETRRIVIAEIQHITYNEWLPLVLPQEAMQQVMASNKFHREVNPSVSNSFASAGIRFIKSLIPGNVQIFNENRVMNESLKFKAHSYKTNLVEAPGMIDSLVRGLVTQKSRKFDLKYTKDLIDWMDHDNFGTDVVSKDVQRGRDHGLPSYNTMRKLCGLPKANAFNDLVDHIPQEIVKMLAQIYNHPDDIDLLIGGMAERPAEGALLGSTFTCLVADQFGRTRAGDRYFYTNADFTQRQLAEIQTVTLAKLLCRNADVRRIQPQGFFPITNSNMLTKCDELPDMKLESWREL